MGQILAARRGISSIAIDFFEWYSQRRLFLSGGGACQELCGSIDRIGKL